METFLLAGVDDPISYEPLDGWIDHLGIINGTKATWIASKFSLPDDRSPYRWVREVSDDVAAHIEQVTGVAADLIHEMTLARYANLGLKPDRARGARCGGTWARGAGARFCPACLSERNYRWDLRWYTTWHFACLHHDTILVDRCPGCGTIPRTFTRGAGGADCPGHCTTAFLCEADVPATPSDPGLWTVQQTLAGLLQEPTYVLALGRPTTPFAYLRDVATIARKVVLRLEPLNLSESVQAIAGQEGWETWGDVLSRELLGMRARTVPDRLTEVAASSTITAFAATVAVRAMAKSDPAEAREALAWCSDSRLTVFRQHVSTELFKVLDPTPSTARTCRYILTHAHEDLTPTEAMVPPLDPSQVPAGLWKPAADGLLGTEHDDFKRLSLSSALLSVGEPGLIAEGVRRLDMEHIANSRAARTWSDLAESAAAADTLDQLIALHRALNGGMNIPIDYARRRRTFASFEPLSMKLTRRLARQIGQRATSSLQHMAGWWLTETLTGTPAMLTQQLMDLPGGIKRRYRIERDAWNSKPPPFLLERAEAALLLHCIDEPVQWSPRFDSKSSKWISPPPETTRTLSGWATRTLRKGSDTRLQLAQSQGPQWADRVVSQAFRGATGLNRSTQRRLLRLAAADQHFSLRETAQCLGVASATMSEAIRALERELGRPLVEAAQRGRPLRLTDNGRTLVQAIRALHQEQVPTDHNCTWHRGGKPAATVQPPLRLSSATIRPHRDPKTQPIA